MKLFASIFLFVLLIQPSFAQVSSASKAITHVWTGGPVTPLEPFTAWCNSLPTRPNLGPGYVVKSMTSPIATSYECFQVWWGNPTPVGAIGDSIECDPRGAGLVLNATNDACICGYSSQQYFEDVQQCVTVNPVTPPVQAKPINNGDCCAKAGDPINIGTGNSFQTQTDLTMATPLSGLSIVRTYNSLPTNPDSNTTRSFGKRWTQPYDVSITPLGTNSSSFYFPANCWQRADNNYSWCQYPASVASQSVSVLRGDGKALYFSSPSNSGTNQQTWTPDQGVSGQLVSSLAADGVTITGYTFTDVDNHIETFDANGVLLTITAQGGSVQRLTYSTGTSNDSSVARYPATAPVCSHVQAGTTVATGTLLCVTDNWGRQLQFEHDTHGRITKTIAPDSQATLYAYDGASAGCIPANPASSVACSANNLTSVTYPDGKTKTLYYNETAQINGGAQCTGTTPVGNGFGYLVNALTGIVDENGNRSVSWTYNCSGIATSSHLGTGVDAYQFAIGTPNSNGNSSSVVTTPLNTPITYGFTSVNGHVVNNSVAQPAGSGSAAATSTSTYDANSNMLSHTDFNGNTTNYTYDTTRNLQLTRVEASGIGQARTTSFQWNTTYRLPNQIAEPLLRTTYTYDTQGNLITKTQQATTDANGSQGFGATLTGTPRTWQYTYNTVGQVLTITGPRTDVTEVTQFAYDTMGNLISVTNAAGQVTNLGNYDLNGRVGTITDPNGLTSTYSYSPRGWLTSLSRGSEVTNYSYDNAGQLTVVTFPNSATLTYTYDNAHRLTNIADNLGNTVNYTLDAMGNRVLEQVNDASGHLNRQISRVIDALNRPQQITGAQ